MVYSPVMTLSGSLSAAQTFLSANQALVASVSAGVGAAGLGISVLKGAAGLLAMAAAQVTRKK